MKKVLVIEDDCRIGNLIKDYFKRDGFEVQLEVDGVEGFMAYRAGDYDLIILDVMLPGIDGFEIAKRIRETSNVPIMMVTARCDDEDQMRGYRFKIDDYVTKPFNPELLLMKANRLIERLESTPKVDKESQWSVSGLTLDHLKRRVTIDGEDVILEPKQYAILEYLIRNKNKVVSREELLNKIWGYDYFGSDRVVDTQIRKLRKSLRHKAFLIKTAFSVGYSFEED